MGVKNAGKGDGEDEEEEKGDVDMEDGKSAPKESWDAFREADEKDGAENENATPETKPRKKRTRQAEPPTSAVMAHDAMQALLDAWEAESDGEAEGGGSSKKGKRKRAEVAASTWIHEDSNIPLDFMSADAAHSVLTVRPPQLKRQRGPTDSTTGAENKVDALRRHGLRFAQDGR